MKIADYFSISEFAELVGLNRKTLIFYDQIGLFSPAHVAENGYRYYSYQQIYVITVILTLKNLGMPLREIKAYVGHRDPQKVRAIFEKQNQLIAQKIRKLESLQDMIARRLGAMQEGLSGDTSSLAVVNLPDIPLFTSRPIHLGKDEIPDAVWLDFYAACEKQHISFGYPVGFTINQENLSPGRTHVVSHLWFHLQQGKYANDAIPGGTYLQGYAQGVNPEDTDNLYQELFAFAQEQGLAIAGNAYEEYLLDEVTTANPDQYLLQISLPVQ